MIYIIGDTHIPIDFKKLEEINDPQIQYVIVAGDFGLLWKGVEDEEEILYKNVLERKNFITLFVKGNHENHFRLQKLPKVNMFGAPVAQISDAWRGRING
jgi:predicted phosphodiesterase